MKIEIVAVEAIRERTNAYEVLMPRPRGSSSPKKLESPRMPPEDDTLNKTAKENRASNKKNLEKMLLNKSKKLNSKNAVDNKMVNKSRTVIITSDSEEKQSVKVIVNNSRRKILSESESDAHESPSKNLPKADLSAELQQSKLKFKPQSNTDKEGDNIKKRNSLFNYFNSVTREEAKKTAEQIKVTVHIHSPPASPGRKPINQKSPADSPRRSARMRLSYESCDQIDLISSEIINVSQPSPEKPRTPVKTPVKRMHIPKAETPKRTPSKTPIKSPVKRKEKPEYVKNLKLKIRAPIKSKEKGISAGKFILSPEALDELFFSPETAKQDKDLNKKKKRKKNPVVLVNTIQSPRKTNRTPKKSPKITKTADSSMKGKSPRKTSATPKKYPKITKAAGSPAKSKSSSRMNETPKKSPKRSKATYSSTKSKPTTAKDVGNKTPKKERSVTSDAAKSPAKYKAATVTRSPRSPAVSLTKTRSVKSLKVKLDKSIEVVLSPSKSVTPSKFVSGTKSKVTLLSKKSAFEEIMSKKKTDSSLNIKSATVETSAKNRKRTKSESSTLANKELLKTERSQKVLKSSAGKINSTKLNSKVASPSKPPVRKSNRVVPSSEAVKMKKDIITDAVKHCLKKRKRLLTDEDEDDDDDDDVIMIESKSTRPSTNSVKPELKNAPVFMKRKPVSKMTEKVEDRAVTEAKRRFLSSGVPECIKKIAEINSQPEPELSIFPTIAHVKQEDVSPRWNLSLKDLKLLPIDVMAFDIEMQTIDFGEFTNQKGTEISDFRTPGLPKPIASYRKILNNLKIEYPNYCVIRNYKRLKNKFSKSLPQRVVEKLVDEKIVRQKRSKKRKRSEVEIIEEPLVAVPNEPSLVWTEKYKPMSTEDVVGNVTEVQQLKTWLETWKRFDKSDDPNYDIIKRKRRNSGSSDEFIEEDLSEEENHSQMPTNTSLIFGPCGSGKTSAVYAIAQELGYKVLEINASSRRTGKHLLKLQEATQSHRVCAQNEVSENIAKMFAQSAKQKKKKVARHAPKAAETEDANNKMSLILIENADIIFEDEDEGFVAALISLVQSSKRPVIIVANDSYCPHLSRFSEQGLVIEMDTPYLKHLCVWLQLICLIEGVRIGSDAVHRLVQRFKGDTARCLNQLQFWVTTGGNNLEDEANMLISSLKEEDNSNSISLNTEQVDECTPSHDECIELFLGNTVGNLIPYPIDLTGIWWNLAPILSLPQLECKRIPVEPHVKPTNASERVNELFAELDGDSEDVSIFDRLKRRNKSAETDNIPDDVIIKHAEKIEIKKWTSTCPQEEMDSVAMLFDNLASADEITSNLKLNGAVYDAGPCPRVWQRKLTDSMSVRHIDRQCWYHEESIAQSIAHFLTERSVDICCKKLGKEDAAYDIALPTQADVRWRIEQQEADNTIVSLVPMNTLVDHRATFVDYLPALQSLCRHENTRLSTNTKRRNRFFHYLRGLGCHPTEEAVNVLCSTFDTGLWRCAEQTHSDASE